MLGKRTLFSWRDSPPSEPTAPEGTPLRDEQNAELDAIRWTDRLCKTTTKIPAVRGMLGVTPYLVNVPIGFIDDPHSQSFAFYHPQKNEITLNADAIKKFSVTGDGEYSDLQHNCLFSILHELRHAHQQGLKFDPWLKTIQTENPQLIGVYDTLVREADATAFALTGMYDLVANADISGLREDSFFRIVHSAPERASLDAFLTSIKEHPRNFYTGAAQQAAFGAYFSRENRALLTAYVEESIKIFEYADYNKGGHISAAFQSAAGRDVFGQAYKFLSGMPSVERNDQDVERKEYLRRWPLTPSKFLSVITPEQFKKMGFDPG